MQTMRKWERSAASAENEGFIIYSEGEDISGFISCLSSSGEQRKKVPARHVPSEHRSSPGFALEQRNIPTLEEATYEFPRGEGIPEEEMEEVHEYEDFWKIKDKVMQMPLYAEEAKKYIDEKLKYVEDYFEKLKFGHLTPADLKEGKPDNFDDPFFPTPQQLEFLNNLNIVVDWPLSELHTYHIESYTIPYKPKAEWKALNIFVDHTRISLRDEKILACHLSAKMKCVILAVVLAVAVAAPAPETPSYGYTPPPEPVKILKDDRTQGYDGRYTVAVEAENGIVLSESGSPDGPEGAIVASGQFSYTAPDGTPVVVKFVADENGFQPESDLLPVAPEFPHPIPQFVLDQIAKAAQEDAAQTQYGTTTPAYGR